MSAANTVESSIGIPKPDRLMQLAKGFWASKVFLVACKIDLFTHLEKRSMTAAELQSSLGLHPRAALDFLDALVALEVILRDDKNRYSNTPESALFFSKSSPAYLGDMMQMSNDRLWDFWGRLEDAVHTGLPQNETRDGGNFFDVVYSDPVKRRMFLRAMIGLSLGSSMELVKTFDFSKHKTFCDIGGGPGTLAATVALSFPNLKVVNFDLPPAQEIFEENMRSHGCEARVVWHGGDCLSDPLPSADLYALGHVLHGWGGAKETHFLLEKVHKALPPGGKLLVIESFIDDERRKNVFGLLMSLDMLIETSAGRNFTKHEAMGWLKKSGFRNIESMPMLNGPHGVLVAEK